MIEKLEPTYWVKIYLSGPIEMAKQIVRKFAKSNNICVTIEPTLYIYSGGEELGYVIGLINYPRFPSTPEELWNKSIALVRLLHDGTFQWSALVMSPERTLWLSDREEYIG